jgi:hypothetical protein
MPEKAQRAISQSVLALQRQRWVELLTTGPDADDRACKKTHANWIAESSLAWRAIPCHAGGPQSITNNPYRTSFPRRYRLERAKLLQGAK